MKYIADIITFSRVIFSAVIVISEPFSGVFWVCYLCGGLTDLIDGAVARKLHQESGRGAKLDSVADLIFAACIFIVMIRHVAFPAWIWACVIVIALIRTASYAIGFHKYHAFASLHTYLNKISGALLFAFPLLYALCGLSVAGIIAGAVGLVSSVEELWITAISRDLNRDCKCLIAEIRSRR